MKIKKNYLINTYAQSIGIETAKELIADKVRVAALEDSGSYSGEEIVRICGELEKEGGLIRIIAQSFLIQLEHKKSEEQTLLLDNIDTQIWYLTDIYTYGAVNKAHAEFLGIEKAGLEDRNLYEIISEEEAEHFVGGNREVFEEKRQIYTEETFKNSKGETRLLSITRTPKLDHNGNVEYVICAAQDITERKKAEERIKHLNSVLKAIRNVNQLIIVEKDRDLLLQKACDTLIETRGYDAAWLGYLQGGETFASVKGSGLGEDTHYFCENVMHNDRPPCIKNALAHKEPLVVIDRSVICDDCFFKNTCTGKGTVIIHVEHAGRLFGLLAVLLSSDLTIDEEEKGLLTEVAGDVAFALHSKELEEAHKQAEEELAKHRDHLEELVKERTRDLEVAQKELIKRERLSVLGQLTATVSHEIRNPLGVIRSSAFYLQRKLGHVDEKITKHLNRVEKQVDLCDSIVDELLEYTRGRHSEVLQGEINPWLEQVLEEITIPEQVTLVSELSPDLPMVHFDMDKMHRVVFNLVNNALQAVTIRHDRLNEDEGPYQPKLKVSTSFADNGIHIEVEDNGIGMDDKTVMRAFEPLFTTSARGTGLGLAIVRKIVEEHGGHVSLDSIPNRGTKVTLVIPAGT
jgi:PAS domain S-box-containing protein